MKRSADLACHRKAETRPPQRPMLLALVFALALAATGCDTAGAPPCTLEVNETPARSATLTDANGPAAQFELQQTRKRYAKDGCRPPEPDVDEVRLLVRNLTNCQLSVQYRLSVIAGTDGWTKEGTAVVQHGAVGDLGVIQRGGISIAGTQVVLAGAVTRTDCR